MTTDRTPSRARAAPTVPALDELEVGALLAEVGPRPEVPAEDLARIHTAARQEWERAVSEGGARSGFRRAALPAALAAGLLLAAAVAWWLKSPGVAPNLPPVASVRQVAGGAGAWVEGGRSDAPGARRDPLRVGDPIAAGSIVGTEGSDAERDRKSAGRLALRLAGGTSLRLDSGTRVRLVSASRLVLAAGTVYVDSGPSRGGPALTVETPLGTVRELGTQFEVRLEATREGKLRVRVREGAVVLAGSARGGLARRVAAGGELIVARDGRVRLGEIDAHGSVWDWVQAVAPSLDVEGVRLDVYLAWVCRETGWRLRYEDRGVAELAPSVVLHGSIAGMTPAESLGAILPGSGLAFRIEGGTLWVTR